MNALAHEKSPYLLQHAANPVDWLPWGDAAFARARAEQKPLFLSIGYSTCHWCHVMAHECFEDAAVAERLNRDFIPVKVDREERPDVDRVYMTYVQAISGHGGWPLNVWLTPDLKPFYGGTYFPPEDREGRPGLRSLLNAIAQGWATNRDQLVGEAERVIGLLRSHFGSGAAAAPAEEKGDKPAATLVEAAGQAFERGFQYFYEAFDPSHAGFGGAPKFPRASNLNFLFRVAALQGPTSELGGEAIKMAAATLEAMTRGGLHDHVGGGFHRYSVDDRWFLPHFEKMLYDQAQIALNCLEARQATGDERFGWVARDIFAYVHRDLTSPAGAFYTAEDADSARGANSTEHAEGAFYVWTQEEFAAGAGEDAALLSAHFGIAVEGNVPAQIDPHGEFKGRNVLAQRRPLLETATALGLDPQAASDRILRGLERLRAARDRRPRPARDDKVLTANNALMISALARAHQVLGSTATEDYLSRATRAAEFLRRELYDADAGLLYRVWRDTRGSIEAFAEDYAFLIQALLDLYEASFELRWLQWAEALQAAMDQRFLDATGGGYFNSAAADASVILRLKEDYDGAEPAPGSVAAMNLFRLAAMLHRPDLRERGRAVVESLRPQWERAPHALPQLLCALELALEPPRHAVLAGNPAGADFQALATVFHEHLGPRRVLLALDGGEAQAWLASRAPWLAEMRPVDGRATAYLCEEYACHAPVSDPAELRRRLGS